MSIQQTLQNEIEDSKRWIECTQEDSTYKRDLYKRIELINWVLEKMKNPEIQICDLIESKMNEITLLSIINCGCLAYVFLIFEKKIFEKKE
jgi:hypothetical protein